MATSPTLWKFDTNAGAESASIVSVRSLDRYTAYGGKYVDAPRQIHTSFNTLAQAYEQAKKCSHTDEFCLLYTPRIRAFIKTKSNDHLAMDIDTHYTNDPLKPSKLTRYLIRNQPSVHKPIPCEFTRISEDSGKLLIKTEDGTLDISSQYYTGDNLCRIKTQSSELPELFSPYLCDTIEWYNYIESMDSDGWIQVPILRVKTRTTRPFIRKKEEISSIFVGTENRISTGQFDVSELNTETWSVEELENSTIHMRAKFKSWDESRQTFDTDGLVDDVFNTWQIDLDSIQVR